MMLKLGLMLKLKLMLMLWFHLYRHNFRPNRSIEHGLGSLGTTASATGGPEHHQISISEKRVGGVKLMKMVLEEEITAGSSP